MIVLIPHRIPKLTTTKTSLLIISNICTLMIVKLEAGGLVQQLTLARVAGTEVHIHVGSVSTVSSTNTAARVKILTQHTRLIYCSLMEDKA